MHSIELSDEELRAYYNEHIEVYRLQTRPLIAYYSEWTASGDPRAPRAQLSRRAQRRRRAAG